MVKKVNPIRCSLSNGVNRLTLILILFLFSHLVFSPKAHASNIVRVAVFQDVSKVTLDIDAPFTIRSIKENLLVFNAEEAKNILIKASSDGFIIAGTKIEEERIEIKRDDGGFISVNGRSFRGILRFIKEDSFSFFVLNYLNLEDYIRGVLYHEISHLWPLETIKAQAVVVRTFTLWKRNENKDKEFDLTNDTFSQMYGGRTSERWRTNKGVDVTCAEVLTYQGKIFPTYYHATCGGHTEDASNLWEVDVGCLKGVSCSFCKDSPHFKWDTYFDFKYLQERLNAQGYQVDKIKKIEIIERSQSNRVLKLKIISETQDLEISAKALREIIGPKILRSTNFEIKVSAGFVFFDGFGWGHGVGLCQWGAYFMGKEGFKYREILKHYYPGAKLESYR